LTKQIFNNYQKKIKRKTKSTKIMEDLKVKEISWQDAKITSYEKFLK